MKFIVKYFPEITIKSRPVRKQFTKQLYDNLRKLLKPIDPDVEVIRDWDKLTVASSAESDLLKPEIIAVLSNTPGIAHFLDIAEFALDDLQGIFERTREIWGEKLGGKSFAVRCKRVGQHAFKSGDVEHYVGRGLNQHCETGGVDLRKPDVTVGLEVTDDRLYIIKQRYEGLGGYPLGSLDSVLSLISGGFDSTVSTYLTMKRGMRTHFCFFNLGGRDHEIGVKEVALYLWMKYGASSRVKFVVVPFENVVSEILKNVNDSQMGVVLKRMMLRAADEVASNLKVSALVTGESVAQVSSQTLTNLSVIDSVTNNLVLRPLIASNKGDIINIARSIGTEEFAAVMPEYCGVISVKPTTRAKREKIEHEESKFDFSILKDAVNSARYQNIDALGNDEVVQQEVEIINIPVQDSVIIDVRHPSERDRQPLKLAKVEIIKIPFYELHSQFAELDKNRSYLLYCGKGVMSRLHASHLLERGYTNVKVYRPN